MKRILLSLALSFLSLAVYAQCNGGQAHQCGNSNYNTNYVGTSNSSHLSVDTNIAVAVYPNPSSNYITFEDNMRIKMLRIYNINGKMMKSYTVTDGQTYSVTDLNEGMYILQFLNRKGKVLNTQRFRKVSNDF